MTAKFEELLARQESTLNAGNPVHEITLPAGVRGDAKVSYEIEAGNAQDFAYQHTDAPADAVYETIKANASGTLPTPLGVWPAHRKLYVRRLTADVDVVVLVKRML